MPEYDDNTYLDTEATEERLDQQVKELVWDSVQKKFVPYPVCYKRVNSEHTIEMSDGTVMYGSDGLTWSTRDADT